MNWVLLRGLTREARHWEGFAATLAGAMAGARVATPDLPGCGTLHDRASPSRIEDMVEACRAGLSGIAPPFHVLGLSLGGMVAAAWSCRYPGEIAACVLVNTSMRPWARWNERLNPRLLPTLLRVASRAGSPVALESAILRLTSAAPDAHAGLAERWAGYRSEYPVSASNAMRQLLAAARFRAPEVAPPAPLLVLCSRGDRLVDPQCSIRLAAAWNARLAVHPTAGHDLPLDDGPWVAARVREWTADLRR